MALPAQKLLRFNCRLLTLSVVLALGAPASATAQIPGHWELAFRAPHWKLTGMQFGNAEHGVILIDSSWNWTASLVTTSGGMDWKLIPINVFQTQQNFDPISFHTFDMPTASDVYDLNGVATYVSRDGGVSWKEYKLALPPCSAPASWSIFANGIGRAIVWNEGLSVWTCKDSAEYFYQVQSWDWLSADSIRDVIFLDTSEFWASYEAGQVVHTTDAGVTWMWVPVMPFLDTFHTFSWLSSTSDRERFYVLIGQNLIPTVHNGQEDTLINFPSLSADFVETTDDGHSWRIDSSIGSPRIYRLVSAAPKRLWAFIGRVPSFYFNRADLSLVNVSNVYPRQFADSLFYSPDDGRTWYKDSTTFADDTLLGMCWPDSQHGYIAAWRDSTLLVYRFIPNAESVESDLTQAKSINIYPNPAASTITITSSYTGRCRLLDILGREMQIDKVPASGTLTLDVSSLAPGLYYITDGHTEAKFVKE